MATPRSEKRSLPRTAILLAAALAGIAGCGGSNPPQIGCSTPLIGLVELLYPVPKSTVSSATNLVIYGIAQPFPNSATISGKGPFPITLTSGAGSVATTPTTLPSPLPSPMATPGWPPDQQSEIYAVSFPALAAGTAYSVVATEPTYFCTAPNVRNAQTTIGSFNTR